MSWLLRDGDVLAALEDQRKGWQRSSMQGALLLRRPAWVHTLIDPAPLDVAWCGPATLPEGVAGLRVKRIKSLAAHRVAPPLIGTGAVLIATMGTFERWHLRVGDCLEVRGG